MKGYENFGLPNINALLAMMAVQDAKLTKEEKMKEKKDEGC